MEQLNNALSTTMEENKDAAALQPIGMESPLLNKVRQKFEITGLVSLIFGGLFTFSFYKAAMGINALFFTGVMIALLFYVMKGYEIPMKRGTLLYYSASLLLGLSTALTSNGSIQMMNTLGTILLLNLAILHQLHEDGSWKFAEHLSKVVGMLFHGIASIFLPFSDGVIYLKKTRMFRNDKVRNVFLGILLSLPILWLVIVLLSGADMLFSDITINIFRTFFSPEIFAIGMMVLFGFLSCYCILCGAAAQTGQKVKKKLKKGASAIAETVMLLISLVYALFCGIQIIYLFAGGLFALPVAYTYAEYARGGFFQLLAVTIINVLLMILCTTFFLESRLLKILLTVMTACTYIMIFSAGYRMCLYIVAYNLTFLRVMVVLALLIITLILAGVIVSVYRESFPLFKYSVAVITICYLIFAFSKPDYFIADYFINQKQTLEEEDVYYLTHELSLDAAPVVAPLFQEKERFTKELMAANSYPMINSQEDSHVVDGSWTTLDYYGIMYYQKIQRQFDLRDFREYGFSYQTALKYSKNNPIKYYKN